MNKNQHQNTTLNRPIENNLVKTISTQLLGDKPVAVTYTAVEMAITAAGFDPFEVSDLYQDILQALDDAHVPVVEKLDTPSSSEHVDDLTLNLADETLAQLHKTRNRIDQFSHTLLTAADERRLLEIYQDGVMASGHLQAELSLEHRLDLERRIAAGRMALDDLVRHNLRLVAARAYKFSAQTTLLDVEDLIQEGMIGLLRAIELFRLDFGGRLSTYATHWIRQAISRAIADQDRMIRLPVYLHELLINLNRATQKLTINLGRAPSDEELAAEIGKDLNCVRQLQQLRQGHLSLDLPTGSSGETTLGDILPDVRMFEPEIATMQRGQLEAVRHLVDTHPDLSEIERQIIILRFGIGSSSCHTLQEIGDLFKYSRERIRQLEVRAIRKLSDEAASRHLMDYLEE